MSNITFFQCYDEAVIDEMTEDREMMTNPDLVEARKDLKKERGENPLITQKMMKFDPRRHASPTSSPPLPPRRLIKRRSQEQPKTGLT